MGNLLDIKKLSFKYKNDFILENLSFSIGRKKIYTLLGSNNSGKTTLIKILSGINTCEYNYVFDGDTFKNNSSEEYLSKINFFIPYNKIRKSKKSVNIFVKKWGSIYKCSKSIINAEICKYELDKIIESKIFELNDYDFFKMILCSLMLKRPKILFLDNVFDNMSFEDYSKSILFINKIQKESDVSIVFTSIKLDRCLYSDRVLFLNNKKIELDCTSNKILEHDNVLAREGIIISLMLDLSLKLRFYGLCDSIEMNPKGMVDKLWD